MSKATPWVKWFPGDFLHGVSDLEANEIVVYVIVLNLIYDKQAPWPYDAKRLARRCHLRQNVVEEAVDGLISYGKLVLVDGCLTNEKAEKVIGKRQEVSGKAAAAAEARWQEEKRKDKKNNGGGDADALRTGSEPDAKLEARDQKPEKKKAAPKKAPPPPDLKLDGGPDVTPARQAFDLYNELAERIDATKALDLTEARRKAINARLNGRGIDVWKEAIEKVERSLFLCGEAKARGERRAFKLSLDMMVRPENFQKILEGFYGEDREPGARDEELDPRDWSAGKWARVLEIWRVREEWPDDAGPEPGTPGYLGPSIGDDYDRQ